MRTLVHLSDLHFGAVNEAVLEPLRARLQALAPDLLVVSGDLTQRAKPRQFEAARAFLATLPRPQIVVPGNHDVPLYNVYMRFFKPLERFRRLVTPDLEPAFIDEEIAVVGVNTSRSFVFKGGRINEEQVASVRAKLCDLPESVTKILVTHHPLFALMVGDEVERAVGRQELALGAVEQSGVDMLLAGHAHHASSQDAGDLVTRAGGVLVVQAGTATSTRVRHQEQSFNTIDVAHAEDVTITVNAWDGAGFEPTDARRYCWQDEHWKLVQAPEPAH